MSLQAVLLGPEAFDRIQMAEKPASYRHVGAIDVTALRAFVDGLSELDWESEDRKKFNKYSCFNTTMHVVPRFYTPGRSPELWFDTPLWPQVEPLVAPVFAMAAAQYGFSRPLFPKVMFARLAAGGHIPEHVDAQKSNFYIHKIHVPLITAPEVWMTVAGERAHLEVGEVYEVNNCVPHAVDNRSDIDRVHLIFEMLEGPQ